MRKRLEEYLRTTLASIGDAVISTDAEGCVVFVNQVALSLLRATEANVKGKHIDQVFNIQNEFTRRKLESPLKRVLGDGVTVGLANHTVLIAQDGTEIPIDDTAAPIRGDDGEVQGAVLVFRDITPRRQAELTQQLLAAIVEASDDAIISKNLNGIITSWNRGAERIFGYSAADMIGKPISTIAAPDRVDEMPRMLESIKAGERIEHYETARRAKDGKIVNISLTVSPVHDKEGRIVGASKIARDITDQLRVRAELAQEKERLRVTLRSIGDGVITTDSAARVAYLNPVAEELTGWESSEAVGKPLEEVFKIINEDSRETVENPARKVLKEGIIVGLANHTLLITKDGKERSIDDSGAPIRVDGGELSGVVLVFRDVTERRAGDREFHTQALQLRRTNEELNQFAYAVTHDLREPLRNVVNFSQLLVREYRGRSESDVQTFVGYITEGVQRMEMLLNDLLAYSQSGGPLETSTAPVDTNKALKAALDNLRMSIAESGAVVTSDYLPSVYSNDGHLMQVFQNLVSNAIKYRRSDTAPSIHVRAQKIEHEWIFGVRDNGIGISPEYQATIFGLFKRLHGREIQGTGIGLAICSKVIERHGGRIWVTSEPGQGSEFFFSLPVKKLAASGH